jgi:hypothetical protein
MFLAMRLTGAFSITERKTLDFNPKDFRFSTSVKPATPVVAASVFGVRKRRCFPASSPFVALFAALASNCILGTPPARAQLLAADAQERPLQQNGFHLSEVTASGGYAAVQGFGGALGSVGQASGAFNGYSIWASLTAGYTHNGPSRNFSIAYTPTYTNVFRDSAHWFDQQLSFQYAQRLGPRWEFHLSGSGGESTALSLLLQPQGGLNAASGGIAIYDNSAILAPTVGLLFGTRVLTFNGTTGVSYNPSTRLSLSITATGAEIQGRPDKSVTAQGLFQRASVGQGNVSLGYALSPRTEIGVDASFMEGDSSVGQYRSSTAGLFFARKLARHWSASGLGSFAWISSVGTRSVPQTFTSSGFGSLRYQARESVWAITYRRTAGDLYGFGSTATNGYSVSWNWRGRGRSWGLQASADRQQMEGGALHGIDLWDVTLGATRSLGRQVSLRLEGSYSRETLAPQGNTSLYAARLTISWIPLLRDTLRLSAPGQ